MWNKNTNKSTATNKTSDDNSKQQTSAHDLQKRVKLTIHTPTTIKPRQTSSCRTNQRGHCSRESDNIFPSQNHVCMEKPQNENSCFQTVDYGNPRATQPAAKSSGLEHAVKCIQYAVTWFKNKPLTQTDSDRFGSIALTLFEFA
jgi:hypothetical protein